MLKSRNGGEHSIFAGYCQYFEKERGDDQLYFLLVYQQEKDLPKGVSLAEYANKIPNPAPFYSLVHSFLPHKLSRVV